MRLLLTSAGIKNASIHDALVDLLGKPIAESSRPLHSHRVVRAPHGRSSQGLELHQRTRAPLPDVKVTDGTVEVVSEGHWKLFTP